MINLLPLNEKEALRKNYRLRVAIVGVFFLGALFLISSGILFSFYLLLNSDVRALEFNLAGTEKDKNVGIHIREFSVHNGQMLLIGIADTREEFIVFIDELEGEKLFSEVSSPISNLSKTKDISFEIAITLAP